MAKQISSVLETDELLRVILRKAIDLLGAQKCAIYKYDNDKKELIYVDSIGYKKELIENLKLKSGEEWGIVGYATAVGVFASRFTIYQDYTKRHILDNDKLQVSFCQPIVHNGNTLAVLCVDEIAKDLSHERTARLLSTLANFGGIALTNTKLVDRIREQSIRDSLTWLYNHQYFQDRLDLLLNQAKREKGMLGLIMVDIDHFKHFNDTYGHQVGDFVLKKTADILNSQLRGSDLIARYGGEEFSVVLPGGDIKYSSDVAERIRKVFEKSELEFEGKGLKVTVSCGVCAYSPLIKDDIGKDMLVKYADEALYKAKETGRNRVVIHEFAKA
jgi:diguanylate cyclase (GGDEF)-like protein